MNNKLKEIIEYKKQELEARKRKASFQDQQKKAGDTAPALSFLQNFTNEKINIIAEVKKASPSKGVIREDFKPVDIAMMYEEGGASSLSVLTDENFFMGHLDYLTQIRQMVKLPLLRKDFTLSEYHIFEARGAGADAVLLNANVLDDHQLKDYNDLATELGMTALMEIHDEDEWNRVKDLPLKLLGVNNRYLDTFGVDTETTDRLLPLFPKDLPVISESGLKDHETLARLKEKGVAGFLIGETLMKAKSPGAKLKELISIESPFQET